MSGIYVWIGYYFLVINFAKFFLVSGADFSIVIRTPKIIIFMKSIKIIFPFLLLLGYVSSTSARDTLSYERDIIELVTVFEQEYDESHVPLQFLPYLSGRKFIYSSHVYNDGYLLIRHWGIKGGLTLVQEVHLEQKDLLRNISKKDTIVVGINNSMRKEVFMYCDSLSNSFNEDQSVGCTFDFELKGEHLTAHYVQVLWTVFVFNERNIENSILQTKFQDVYIIYLE